MVERRDAKVESYLGCSSKDCQPFLTMLEHELKGQNDGKSSYDEKFYPGKNTY